MNRLMAKAGLAAGACLATAFAVTITFAPARAPSRAAATGATRAAAAGPFRAPATGITYAAAAGTTHLMAAGTRPPALSVAGPAPTAGALSGVSARNASDAWAVGFRSGGTCAGEDCTLTERWNGHAWASVRSPSPSRGYDELSGVSAVSGQDAWAVGAQASGVGSTFAPLALHWNGRAWSAVRTPRGDGFRYLAGVSARTRADVWAVGEYDKPDGTPRTLTEHWDGRAWSVVPSPSPGLAATVSGISAVSADDAWAAGLSFTRQGVQHPLMLHWNGRTWATVPTPAAGGAGGALAAVSAASATDAWAVGFRCTRDCRASPTLDPLAMHWDGKSWSVVATAGAGMLTGVSARPGGPVWAAGSVCVRNCGVPAESDRPVIMRWAGGTWSRLPVPGPGTLTGVASVPAGSAWAVGEACTSNCRAVPADGPPLILRWNGTAWSPSH